MRKPAIEAKQLLKRDRRRVGHCSTLGEGGNDAGKDFDGAVKLHHHAGKAAQCFVVLWCGGDVDDHQRQAVDGHHQGDVVGDAVHVSCTVLLRV